MLQEINNTIEFLGSGLGIFVLVLLCIILVQFLVIWLLVWVLKNNFKGNENKSTAGVQDDKS